MADTKHTPTQLGLLRLGFHGSEIVQDSPTGHDDETSVESYCGHLVAESVNPALAKIIIQRCNAHDTLLVACENLYTVLSNQGNPSYMDWLLKRGLVEAEALSAIDLAKRIAP